MGSAADESAAIRAACIEAHCRHAPHSVALALGRAAAEDAARVLGSLPPSLAASVVSAMPALSAARLAALLPLPQAAEVCSLLPVPSLANLLRCLDADSREPLHGALDGRTQRAVAPLLSPAPDRVAAHVDPHVLSFDVDTRAEVVLESVRACSGELDESFFVTDDKQVLVGLLDWHVLLRAAPHVPVGALMRRDPQAIAAGVRVADAFRHPGWLHARALAVTDADGHLLGALRREALARADAALGPMAAGPDAGETAREVSGLLSIGVSALLRWAGSGLMEKRARE